MPETIQKIKFKPGFEFEIEILPLAELMKREGENLILPHRTNFYHIFLFEISHPVHFVDFEPIQIKPFSLLFIHKDRVHRFDKSLDYEGYVLIFTDDFYCNSESDKKFLKTSILFNPIFEETILEIGQENFNQFHKVFQDIDDELRLPKEKAIPTILKNLLHNLLLKAEREITNPGFWEQRRGADLDYAFLFMDLVELKFIKQKNVVEYARQIFISEKRLGQATSKVFGKSPKEIINERVLLEAKRLLGHSNLSIKEIGRELGFEDPAYFVRYFKKRTANTPVEFRERAYHVFA